MQAVEEGSNNLVDIQGDKQDLMSFLESDEYLF